MKNKMAGILAIFALIIITGCTGPNQSAAQDPGRTLVLMNEINSSASIAIQKIGEGNGEAMNGRYAQARSLYGEAETHLDDARAKYDELCSIAPQFCASANSVKTKGTLDYCFAPSLGFLMNETYLFEDIGRCGASGCPDRVRANCQGLIASANEIDAECGKYRESNLAASVQDVCKNIV